MATSSAAGLLFGDASPTEVPNEPEGQATAPANEQTTPEQANETAPADEQTTPEQADPADPAAAAKEQPHQALKPKKKSSKKSAKSKKKQRSSSKARTREKGWEVGGYIFNFTGDGSEPSPSAVRNRYWRNVASAKGSAMFGVGNRARMAEGKAPQRRNPRTGKMESMHLPLLSFQDTGGAIPTPEWPGKDVDPFQNRTSGTGQ